MPTDPPRTWRYVRALTLPALLWVLLMVLALREPLQVWLKGEEHYDQEAMREWIEQAIVASDPLPEMVRGYLDTLAEYAEARLELVAAAGNHTLEDRVEKLQAALLIHREEIREHLKSLGEITTKKYSSQLPLFPVVYKVEVRFDLGGDIPGRLREPIVWDSELPRREGQYRELEGLRLHPQAALTLHYKLHAYSRQQQLEQVAVERWWRVWALIAAGVAGLLFWLYLDRRGVRERELQRRRIDEAERQRLQEELRREDAERQALELKSQLYASIGIMAGSYAHNIKNLLVRPNDLLRRCLEADGMSSDQERMLHEVRDTLGTVTERLQQILRTVRRDPGRSELARLDLNEAVADIARTWKDLAREKWKLELSLDLDTAGGALWIQGDPSHLQQAAENLLFNARDATFEMRNHLRTKARQERTGAEQHGVRQALIAAVGWRGKCALRTRREGGHAVLEVWDNGIGMTEEVRRRCTETHFSTKRDNALYEGAAAGMGLGLSFVVVILEHHAARLEIESEPLRGTTFRARFPLAK